MAARANWKGYLKLSLVSCPVQLFPATSAKERVSFHLLNRETGNRLRRKLVDPETDEPVESEDQVKGYQVGKNDYILVEEEEFEKVAVESSHTIDIETFVPRTEVDEAYLDTPYFLTPDGKMAEEAFSVIREAMREKGVCGIGRVVLYRRERPILLEPRGKGLVATTLRYAYEVRSDDEFFEDIGEHKVEGEMLDLATHIIGRKMAKFEPKRFEDRYQDALLAIIDAKRNNKPVKSAPAEKKPSNVVSLMDALRKSIAADKGGEESDSKTPSKTAKKSEPKSDTNETKPAAKKTSATPASSARRTPAKLKRAS